jgi:PAS domain S-box-containing protein
MHTREAVESPVIQVLRTGHVMGFATPTLLMAKDGTERPIDDSAAPIRTPAGVLLGVILVFRDITERLQAEAVQTRLAAIVESADDAIISKTMEGVITSWNRGAERLYGYTAADMVGQPIARLIPPDLADDFPRIMARLRQGERLEHYETQRLAKDGTRLDVSLTISPLRDRTGQVIGASKIARDITARKQVEAALAQAAATLEARVAERTAALACEMAERQRLEQEAQRAEHFALLGRLAAGVSHELRNPLAAVFLHIDLLDEELHDQAPESAALVADLLTEIRQQLARVDTLVQDYLSLVRAAQVVRVPQDLGALLCAWAAEWQALATPHGITCQWDGLAALGTVAVHANTLYRALLNLVQNALEAMAAGGTLIVAGCGTATHVEIQVRDTGSGMPPETLARIFEPLYTTKPGGTGLGLYPYSDT